MAVHWAGSRAETLVYWWAAAKAARLDETMAARWADMWAFRWAEQTVEYWVALTAE